MPWICRHKFWVLFIICFFAAVAWGISLTGCSTLKDGPPRVQAVGWFTEAEMRDAVNSVFGPGTYARHSTGQNVRQYNTFRYEDYRAVGRWVWQRTEPWSWGWLCVQFSQEMRMAMQRAAVRSGYDDKPAAIGWFIVNQRHAWGGVPAGGRHALNTYVAGPRGEHTVHVKEPQSQVETIVGRQMPDGSWHLYEENYPNLPYVEEGGVFLEL